MYLDNLDELDQKIIQLLIENARISYSDIGEETGISRVVITWILGERYRASMKRCKIVKVVLLIIVIYFTRSYMIACTDYDKNSVTQMHPYYFFFEKE